MLWKHIVICDLNWTNFLKQRPSLEADSNSAGHFLLTTGYLYSNVDTKKKSR
jgi:hypothetical protein